MRLRRDPFKQIQRRAMRNAADRVYDFHDPYCARGDTPIETLLFTALKAEICIGCHEHTNLLAPPRGQRLDPAVLQTLGMSALPLIIESQITILEYRVDFLVSTPVHDRSTAFLIVECDGHDYHERTKEQAAKDRSRDRKFQAAGYPVFRFTGSEIWRDPCRCADQIIDWASEKVCL